MTAVPMPIDAHMVPVLAKFFLTAPNAYAYLHEASMRDGDRHAAACARMEALLHPRMNLDLRVHLDLAMVQFYLNGDIMAVTQVARVLVPHDPVVVLDAMYTIAEPHVAILRRLLKMPIWNVSERIV